MNDIINNCKFRNGKYLFYVETTLLRMQKLEDSQLYFIGVVPTTSSPTKRSQSPDHPNPALPITDTPSQPMHKLGWALRALLLADSTTTLKDRKVSINTEECK